MISANNKSNRKSSLYVTFVALFAIFLIILGLAGYYAVKREIKNNIKSLLQLNLSANLTALKSWINDKKLSAETIASEPQVLQAIYSIMALENGVLPPTINYTTPDPECDLDYVPNKARETKVDICLSNSFGFGGTNGVLVFKKFSE